MGGTLNACTSREHTMYVSKVFKDDVEKAVNILSDIIQNSQYKELDIAYERGVVLREMDEVYKQVQEFAMDHLHELAFRDSPYSQTILGPEENIRSFNRDSIVEYVNSYYTADRIVVVGTGAVEHDYLCEMVEKYFTSRPEKSAVADEKEPVKFYGGIKNFIKDISTNNTILLGYEGPQWTHEDLIPALLVQTMQGQFDKNSGVSKYLFSRLARTGSLHDCETISPFITSYNRTGIIGCNFSTKSRNLAPLMKAILSEHVNYHLSFTDEEIERAKHKLKANYAIAGYDDVVASCEETGRQVLSFGRRVTLDEITATIESLTTEKMREVCHRRFVNVSPAVITVGVDASLEIPDYDHIRAWTGEFLG